MPNLKNTAPSGNEKKIFIFDAHEGMILAKDVLNSDGSLIAASGTILDMNMIAKISGYHILEVFVKQELPNKSKVSVKPGVSQNTSAEPTYFDKIRESEEFKIFNNMYESNIDSLKHQLDDIVNAAADIDVDAILEQPLSIIEQSSNKLQMFEMLHSLKDKDDLTYAHSTNVAIVASIIGQWLHYPEEDIKALTLCGLLHDIGKLTIDPKLLNKPGKLTAEEFDIMKSHVNKGYDLIKDTDIDGRIKEACLLHHERCDGSGYPFGLKGDQIPPFAKIIAIADIYDAMTASRAYRGAVCPFHVIHMMEKDAFSRLDPEFTLPFLKNVVSSYIHNNVRLSDGRLGEVIFINDRDLSRPIVKCNDVFVDLSKTPGVEIEAVL